MPIVKMDVFENSPRHYKLKKIAGPFIDKYIQYKNDGNEKLLIEKKFKKIISYLGNIDNLKASVEWKVHLPMKSHMKIYAITRQ